MLRPYKEIHALCSSSGGLAAPTSASTWSGDDQAIGERERISTGAFGMGLRPGNVAFAVADPCKYCERHVGIARAVIRAVASCNGI